MESHVSQRFRRTYKDLPPDIRKEAREAYRLFKNDPQHPSLNFEEISVNKNKSMCSARVTLGYRVLGAMVAKDVILWKWIGTHTEYDKHIKKADKGGIAE